MLKKSRIRKAKVRADDEGFDHGLGEADAASGDLWCQVRRCHRCGSVHESKGDRVLQCTACKAHFAPYFFAELTPEALSELLVRAKPVSLVLTSAKRYRPIIGITWWWNEGVSPSGEIAMPRA